MAILTDYVIMPSADYQATCDAIREKTGKTDILKSGELASEISSVTGGGSADVRYVTFMNGDTVLWVKPVAVGDDCVDVYTKGIIEKPTKESTVQYDYAYSGWSESVDGTADSTVLQNITENKTVYAVFTESVRKYTVRFYDGDTLLNTEQIAYGGSSDYTYKKENYILTGWNPAPTNVTGDMDCYGQFEESYTFADASWDYISDVSERGIASDVFAVGDTKDIILTIAGQEYTLPIQIVGFNHDDKSDGTGKAGISITTLPIVSTYHIMKKITGTPNTAYTVSVKKKENYLWSTHVLRTALNNEVLACFPADLQGVIKAVNKLSKTMTSGEYTTTSDKIWIPSEHEMARVTAGEGTIYDYFYANFNVTEMTNRRKRTTWTAIGDTHNTTTPVYETRSYVSAYYTVSFNHTTGAESSNNGGLGKHLLGFCV